MAAPGIIASLVAAIALGASPAFAGSVCTDLVPPAHYLDMPAPAHTVVHVAGKRALQRMCRNPAVRLGCADSTTMTIYVLAELRQDPVRHACLMRHELAHLKGWPGDHPSW